MTVMETYGLNDRQPQVIDTPVEAALLSSFKKLPGTWDAFKKFAIDNGLDVTISETNGDKAKAGVVSLVVTAPVAGSTTADTTPTFSGTGTPGANVAITIAGTTVNTTVGPDRAWSVDFSTLASGAKSAVVVLSKDNVTATVTRNFTIS
jgi:hypothetical protein